MASPETGTPDFGEETLQRIYWVQTELADLDPSRNDGLVPNAPADAEAIERAERRLGRTLPPSYRAFLARHDGWSRFFDGTTLLGTKDLGKASYADLAQAAFEAAETPIPDGGAPWSKVGGRPGDMIPFGIEPTGATLFAFDPSCTDADGEMAVVAWIHEIGLRSASFPEFLRAILELCEADRTVLAALAKRARPAEKRRERECRGEEIGAEEIFGEDTGEAKRSPRSGTRARTASKRRARSRDRAAG